MNRSIKIIESYGRSIFCEDVRFEKDDRFSIIGVFPEDLIVPQVPVILPKFAIYVEYLCAKGSSFVANEIQVFLPGNNEPSMVMPLEQVDVDNFADQSSLQSDRETDERGPMPGMPITRMVSISYISPLKIEAEGQIRVRAVNDESYLPIGALTVRIAEVASKDD